MKLKDLLKNSLQSDSDINEMVEISNLSRDSNIIEKNDAYFCLSHDQEKAKMRCKQALDSGAEVAISDFDFPFPKSIKVNDTRHEFALACKHFYENACDDLRIVGITGTNGKTTTSHVIAQMLKRNGKKVGVIGTSGVFYDGKVLDCPLTTPDADFLHKTFLDMKKCGVEYVIMEVSAHAIDQKRVDGIDFEIGVLTNITQDHLDYFKNIEDYANTKLSFFTKGHVKTAIVCADDEYARRLIGTCTIPVWSYGLKSPSDIFAIDVFCAMEGTHFVGNVSDSILDIKTNLIGEYNVYNSLAALGVCKNLGLDDYQLASGLNFMNPVEGRFNVINLSGKHIVIDYAHSPDSLKNVLKTAKDLAGKHKVFVVFGCGGNRDKSKRPQMGAIAQKYADFVCLTDDNPRFEKSEDIIADIEQGMNKSHMVECDRSKAIRKVVELAQKGDLIIIAGKGAEKYQEVGSVKRPYSDYDAVYQIFKSSSPFVKEERARYDC